MSIQSARDFLAKVASDEQFRCGLTACKPGAEQQKYAQAAGFDFTSEEINTVRSEIQDADLDVVSGGCCGAEGGGGAVQT